MIFWVPQSGRLALGVSILSYAGALRLGVAVDQEVIPAPDELVRGFAEAIEEMLRDLPAQTPTSKPTPA